MIDIEPKALRFLVDEWVRCEAMLERAVNEAAGTFDIGFVWSEVISGRSQFWPMPQAALVSRIETYPSGLKACLLWLCGGSDLGAMKQTEQVIAGWARRQGCGRIEIVGRRGWLKALDGFREGGTILVKELT